MMKQINIKLFLIGTCLSMTNIINAQVSIGTQFSPHSRAILDLTNTGDNLGLLLPITLVDPSIDFPGDPEGMLIYYSDNLFLKQGPGTTGEWNAITPWKSIFTGTDQTDVYFNPAGFTPYAPPGTPSVGGVGIGLSSGVQGNLHIALKSKDVKLSGTTAPLLIGESDAVTHLSIDNDEILVKTDANTAGTLKLQEEGGSLTIGSEANSSDALTSHLNTTIGSTTNSKNLNVFGEIQQNGFALVPVGAIIMWTGGPIPTGWALCDGGTYAKIDGSGPITAPDLSGRFIVGLDPTDPDYAAIGINGNLGTKTTTLTEAQIPTHTHTTDPGGAHAHTIYNMDTDGLDHDASGSNGQQYWRSNNGSNLGFSGGDHTHTISNTGGGGSHENRPPYYALAFIMKL